MSRASGGPGEDSDEDDAGETTTPDTDDPSTSALEPPGSATD
jgi:hypothetical protein